MRIHHNNISIFKRIAAVCTACCLFTEAMGTVHEINNTAFAEDTQNTFMIDQKRTLAYAGGRSYTMTLDAASYFSNGYSPASTQQSEDNYYTAPYDGKYLVQLWGGDGGDGNSFEYVSGKGGAGGYVWSIVTLEKGDVLLYNIGTKGTSTVREDTGGGVNGNGGAHGDDGSLHIGGGGGFSAVYYYPKGTFDGSIRPSEADRMSRYIMIAGGGGGGGGFELDSLFFRTNLPDGGSGGHMGTSASGVISDSAVPGTYFAGSDGKSSGTSQAYVGKGGTYKPGAAVTSDATYILFVGNVRSSSESGNDWFRISLPDVDGGSGGAGNLNGGAGGAGYCGGSGGAMKALLNNDNTGGGGGGSSFLASAEYMTNDTSKLSPSEQVMYNNSLSEKSNSSQGGYCNIAYLSSEKPDLSVYESAAFSIPVSEYFDLTAVDTKGNGTWNAADNTITGVDISPDEHGRENNHADITLTFTAKDTFPGGNNVPLLDGQIGMSATSVTLPAFDADKDLDKVNVPLAYTLDTFSFWHDKYTDADASIAETDLYSMNCTADSTDAYGNVISAVTMYPALTTPDDRPQKTQTFDISYTVTPNEENKAKVGPVQHERTYSGTAVVNIREEDTTYVPDSDNLDTPTGNLSDDNSDIKIKTSRSLDYTGSSYQTVITVSASSKKVPYNIIENYSLATSPLTMIGNNITIPEDGWYLLEVWGGDGGDGQAADGANDASGGKGGNGGYVYGFKEFHKNDMLECTIGASGTVPGNSSPTKSATKKIIKGAHGNGGGYSAIKYGDEYLIIAGGGGAGGGGISTSNYLDFIDGGSGNGGDGQENNEISSELEKEMNAYSGKAATDANYHPSTGLLDPASISAPSKGGAAGSNYRLSDVYSEFPYNSSIDASIGTSGTANPSGEGLVKVTRIIKETSVDEQDRTNKKDAAEAILKNISFDLSGTWSPYFGGSTISQSDIKFDTSKINTTEDTANHTFTADASLKITISANPVNGFLGGNDVPLFKDDALYLKYTYDSRKSATIPLKNSDSLKYVNVAVAEPVFTAKDAEKFYGEEFSIQNDLIESDFSVDTESILDDFVEYELNASPSGSNDPNIGTAKASQKYTLTASLTPDAAEKATVISPVSAVQYSQEAELTVNYKVETELKNITCDADEKLPMHEDLSTTLKAESGYELPSAITVKCGDTVLSPLNGYRYSKTTGELFIPKEKINNNIKIIAEAVIPTYELVFRYYTDADNSMLMEKRFAYPAGTEFNANSTWRSEFYDAFEAEEITGMAFKWNWGETGEESITEMPAQNWFVTGKYSFNQYDLTIHYQDADGNTLAEDYKQTLLYGDEYNAASPAVANHIPKTAVVSGTIEDDTEITVIYEKKAGKLVVVYVDEDGKTVCDNHEETIVAGSTYNAVSPTITGYTPDITAVSGTMPSNGGVYQVVTYSPNTYTLAFNANGGSLSTADSSDRTVYYGKEIGWCGKEDGKYTFNALPVPIKQGSTFKGWKLNGEFVMEDTVFTLTDNAALTAEWEVDAVTLRVYYFFEDGTEAAEAVSYTETPGGVTLTSGVEFPLYNVAENIRTNIANGEHYTTQCDNTVTMGFIDKAVNVIFVGKNYTLTVKYKDENGEISGVTDSYTVKYGTEYQHDARTPEAVDATKYDNHYASPSVIEGTMDGDTTVYVSFIRRGTVINVTVDWSSLVFEAQEVTWDPEQHFYYADSYLTEDTKKEYGTITVTNRSDNSTSIRASLSYSPEFSYENIQAKYTDRDNNTISSVVVPADESAEIRFAPQNRISFIEPGEYNVGTCVVSLSAGG